MFLLALFFSTASAQVTPIPQFVGDHSEGWETQNGVLSCHDVTTIGTNCAIGTGLLHITGGWSFTCSISPNSGSVLLGGGSSSDGHDFEFTTDISQWGAFLATNAGAGATVTIEFYDTYGALYDTVVEPLNNCGWQWYGYSSPVPLSSVHVINSLSGGSYVMTDDIEVDEWNGPIIDNDGDGFASGVDCNDYDATIFPGAPELCNGVDDDCDGIVPSDELDGDGDGITGCAGDCDNTDPAVNPSATEVCDGVDNNCDGVQFPGDEDVDGDGVAVCENDCNDNSASIYPGAPELCDAVDNDCDGVIPADEVDLDGDGVFQCNNDCDDADVDSYPGAPELCDGRDNDCDGVVLPAELDDDGDGFRQCDGDCDDAEAAVYTGAPEICDGLDNDCDGQVPADETDGDGDGFPLCDDCDDAEPNTYPGAPEVDGDGIDNDCDGNDGVGTTGGTTGTATGATGTGTGGVDPVDPKLGGCGCSSTPGSAGLWLAFPLLLAVRRREERSPSA